MDVDLPPGAVSPTAQEVVASGSAASRVEVTPCPTEAPPPDSAPAPGTMEPFRTKVAGAAPASKVP